MDIDNILVLIGPPGSGKGTQGKLLAPLLEYNYLSMGAALRAYAAGSQPDAPAIKETIEAGRIIPDEQIRRIFFDALDALPPARGVILDGFPRDIGQVNILDEAIAKYRTGRIKAVFIDVPKAKIIGRLAVRSNQEARADDDPEVIETRFREYDEKTYPLVDYFSKHHRLVRIDGDQPIEAVHKELVSKLSHGPSGV